MPIPASLIKVLLFTPGARQRWGLPVIFEGDPGVGKTQFLEANARAYGLRCETLIGSIREPSDFGGLPRHDGEGFKLAPPTWAIAMREAKRGLLFLDEINTCMPAMQAAMLRLATDGAIGEFMLPPEVRILGAQNKVESSAGGWGLTAPMANRFGHLPWHTPSPSEWAGWLIGGAGTQRTQHQTASDVEASVLAAWPTPFAAAKGLMAGFLRKNPGLLHKMPAAGSPDAGRAWPSPRTWELATRAHAGCVVHGLDAAASEELIAAFVGIGAAAELVEYQRKNDLPDPADVLDGRVAFKHDPKRLDRSAAVLAACTALVVPEGAERRAERVGALWTIVADVGARAADIVLEPAKALVNHDLEKLGGVQAAKALATIEPVLRAAGFMVREAGKR